jgi:hypothetical protein
MRYPFKIPLVACFAFVAASFAGRAAESQSPPAPPAESPEIQVVRAYIDAFNRHDIPAMAERVAEDFVWFNVTSDSASVEVKGRDKLRRNLGSYFEHTPTVRSEIEGIISAGNYVSFREKAMWSTFFGEKSQTAVAVYEVKNGLITRAWYYPAVK